MVVVPQDLMENLRYNQRQKTGSVGKHVIGVDKEMQNIMTRDDLSQEDKIRLYNNALLKFGDLKPVVKQVKQEKPEVVEEEDEWMDTIDRHFNLQNKGKAKNILSWARDKGGMTWNDHGEITGIPDSNILTLLDDITRVQPRNKSVEPTGMSDFAEKLQESNIPHYLISTYYNQKYFNPTTPFTTPTSSTPRKHRLESPLAKRVPTPPSLPSIEKVWMT